MQEIKITGTDLRLDYIMPFQCISFKVSSVTDMIQYVIEVSFFKAGFKTSTILFFSSSENSESTVL